VSKMTDITAQSVIGRFLIALRAGRMTSRELTDRLDSLPSLKQMRSSGLIDGDENGWFLTEAGRAACPLRNPLAAVITPPPLGGQAARAVPLQTPPTIHERHNRLALPETTGENAMPEPALTKPMTAVSQVLLMLADAPKGVTRKDLITRTGLKKNNIDNAIFNLVSSDKATRLGYGLIGITDEGRTAAKKLKIDRPAIATSAPVVAPPAEVKPPVQAEPPAELETSTTTPTDEEPDETPAPDIDFCVYADGHLAIIDGDEILVLPPDATRRLGHFLGCFDLNDGASRLAC